MVDWAGDLALAGSYYEPTWEEVHAPVLQRTRRDEKFREIKKSAQVWTSPFIVISESEYGRARVAVVKLDAIGITRRARIGVFVVENEAVKDIHIKKSAELTPAEEQLSDLWTATFSVGGLVSSHRRPEAQIPGVNELKIGMDRRRFFRDDYLERAEKRLATLEVNRVIIADAIASNEQNVSLRQHLAAQSR